MALNECAGCTTLFAVGLPRCPHCRSTDFAEQGQDMPKITEHGGATNAAEPGPDLTAPTGAVIATSGAWADEPEPAAEVETEPVEEEPSPGNNSETSSETPSSEPEQSETPTPSPAPTTGSRSRKGRTGSRSASSTAGGPAADTSAADK